MFWLPVLGGLLMAGALWSSLEEAPPPPRPVRRPPSKRPRCTDVPELLREGTFRAPFVLLLGRTGAGKSSIANRLLGLDLAGVGDVSSTTRALTAYPAFVGGQSVTLVDSPGIGEALTHDAFHQGVLRWIEQNASDIAAIMLVVAADSKAHAEDLRLVAASNVVRPGCPLVIALNQCDKMKPVRQAFGSTSWSTERDSGSAKARHISEKIDIVLHQLGDVDTSKMCIPLAAEVEPGFNVEALTHVVAACVVWHRAAK